MKSIGKGTIMGHMEKLLELIQKNNGLIKTSQAEEAGIPRKYLSLLAKTDKLERISHGIYLADYAFEDRMYSLQLRCPTGIFSHETALYLHGLSDREPLKHMMTVKSGFNSHRLGNVPVRLFYIKHEMHSLGETTVNTSFGRIVSCYNRERTLCDMLRNRSQMDPALLNSGFKSYIRSKESNVPLILDYASELGILNIVRNYLEILL